MKKMILVSPDDMFGGHYGNVRRGPMEFDEMKAYKKIKKQIAKEKEEEKKNSPKKEEGFMKGWSVAKRTAFFALAGPPLGIGYVFGLIIIVRQLATFIVGVH